MLRALWRDRRGVSALEFSVIGLVMVTLMLAAYDIGNAAQEQIALQQAVRAGAAYAQYFPTDLNGIQNAVTNALPAGWALNNAPTVSCSCNGAGYVCNQPPANCPSPVLVTISATMPYSPISALFANIIPNNTASYVVRIQ
jgi:Flp pilus assembly protein TadG